jgi:predicted nucleotidyltransferase
LFCFQLLLLILPEPEVPPPWSVVCRIQRAHHHHPLGFRQRFQTRLPGHFAYLQQRRRRCARLDGQARRMRIAMLERELTRLGLAVNASQVILFGSYARGEATEPSDVDLLIVAETDLPRHKRAVGLYKQFRPYPFGMDIVVDTPQEMEEGKKSALSFVSTVLREGKTLCERRDGVGQTVVDDPSNQHIA